MSKLRLLLILISLLLIFSFGVQAQDSEINSNNLIFYASYDYGVDDSYTIYSLDYTNPSDFHLWIQTRQTWFVPSHDKTHILIHQLREETTTEDSQFDIFVISRDDIIQVTDANDNYVGVWSPVNEGEFAYVATDGVQSSIVVANLNNLDEQSVLLTSDRILSSLTWLHDGEKFGYIACTPDFSCHGEVLDLDTHEIEQFRLIEETLQGREWQPFTQNIAVVGFGESFSEQSIYLINSITQEKTLISEDGQYLSLAWDSSGEKLAFSSNQDGDWEIYVYDVMNDELTQVTNNEDIQDGRLGIDWSPDNSMLVISSGPFERHHQLFTIDLETREMTRLMNWGAHATNPIWSP